MCSICVHCARCVQDVCKMCGQCVQGVLIICPGCMHMSCLISLNPTHLESAYWVLQKSEDLEKFVDAM